MHVAQTKALRDAVLEFSSVHGTAISTEVENRVAILVYWIQYLTAYHRTGTADSLLFSVASSIREAAGSLSLGLLRPAIFSLRVQIDLLLGWLYFKDHPVEWAHVNQTADGFKLKKEVFLYLEGHHRRFASRLGILRLISVRTEKEPYRLLSAHIHGQSDFVLPVVDDFSDMVRPHGACLDCTSLVFDVSEYLSDILLALYVSNWHSLPVEIRRATLPRFGSAAQKREFFTE